MINWGDGQTTTGTINSTTTAGVYTVTGNHNYSATSAIGSYSITVTIADQSGQSATAKSTVYVTQFINATGTSLTATVGQPTGSVVVANFTDSNPDLANTSAVINWGDGKSTLGTVAGPNASGVYTVTGNHTYATASATGSYSVTVTITDPSGQTAKATSTVTVAAPTVIATGSTFSTSQAATGVVVANFTDSNTSANSGTITAVINWGDGQTSTGTVSRTSTPDVYTVSGSHSYTIPTGDWVLCSHRDNLRPKWTDSNRYKHRPGPLRPVLSPIPLTINLTAGTPPSTPVTVGSFFDTNVIAVPASFTVSINWVPGSHQTARLRPP